MVYGDSPYCRQVVLKFTDGTEMVVETRGKDHPPRSKHYQSHPGEMEMLHEYKEAAPGDEGTDAGQEDLRQTIAQLRDQISRQRSALENQERIAGLEIVDPALRRWAAEGLPRLREEINSTTTKQLLEAENALASAPNAAP